MLLEIPRQPQGPFAICISGNLWLTDHKVDCARDRIESLLGHQNVNIDIISCVDDEDNARLSDFSCPLHTLGHFYNFSRMIRQRCGTVVLCIGAGARTLTSAALLLGGHLAVQERMALENIAAALRPISDRFVPLHDADGSDGSELTLADCWAALQRATTLGWLDFGDTPSEDTIDMDEHLHYASAANGQLHVVVPNRLLAFPSPHDLPNGLDWMDEDGARRFSPAYFADILRDFDVSVVLGCAGAGPVVSYDPAGLKEHGVVMEALPVEACSGHLLAAGDRLLTLARAAPGAIALHGVGGWEEGLLLAIYLVRLHSFPARQALAWARITHPPAAVAPPRLVLHHSAGRIGCGADAVAGTVA
jgi:hypothetical protein